MTTTVTDHRVIPVKPVFWPVFAVEEFVTVDGVETSSKSVAAFPDQTGADFEAQRRGRLTVED